MCLCIAKLTLLRTISSLKEYLVGPAFTCPMPPGEFVYEGASSVYKEVSIGHDGTNSADVSKKPVSPTRILLYEL